MSTQSSIEWTDTTWNPVRGCSKVSAGCTNCYAMRQAHRFSGPGKPYEGLTQLVKGKGPQWTGRARPVPELLEEPLHWKKPRRVFVNSMSDLFHEDVPDDFILEVFGTMMKARQHVYQILTKRPERMASFVREFWKLAGNLTFWAEDSPRFPLEYAESAHAAQAMADGVAPHIWLGTSVEDQAAADERTPHLLRTPAAVRFLSCEPLLGPVDITRWLWDGGRTWTDYGWEGDAWPSQAIHWIIAGGESGPGARPCDVSWIRSIIHQGREAGVPVFVKQLGARPHEDGQVFAARIPIPVECRHGYDVCPECDAADVALELHDRKGGDPDEWPEDLRVREFPATPRVAQ